MVVQTCYILLYIKQARGKLLYLNMVFANRVAHEHGVEGGHFVHSHAGHSDHLKGCVSVKKD